MFGTDIPALLSSILAPACKLYCMIQVLSFIVGRSLFSTKYCGNDKYSESLPMNIPNGLFHSRGAKEIILSTFSTTSGSCNNVSVTPHGHSSTSHQLLLSSFSQPGFSSSALEILFWQSCVLSSGTISSACVCKSLLLGISEFSTNSLPLHGH